MANQFHAESKPVRTAIIVVGMVSAVLMGGCSSPTPKQQVATARHAYRQHDYHAAEVQLKTLLQKHPDDGTAWALLGRTSMAKGQYDDAIHQFRKAKAAGQPASGVALPLGRALLATGQFEPALKVLHADADTPDKVRAMIASLRGDALFGTQQNKQAAKAYASALSIDPNLSDALRGKARLAIARKDYPSAKRVLTQAVSAHPKDTRTLALLGQLEYRTGDCDGAIDHLPQALKTSSGALTGAEIQTSQAMLADCQLRAGHADAARQNIESVLKSNRNNPFANYLQALLDIRQGDYQKAADHVQATLNAEPQNLRSMTLMAWIRIVQGQPDAAQPFLTRVLDRAPDNVAAVRLQAGLWMAQNQDQQAQDLVEKAAKRHPDQPALRATLSQVKASIKSAHDNGNSNGSGLDEVGIQLDLARTLAHMGSGAAAQTVLGKIKPKTSADKREIAETRIQIALTMGDTDAAVKNAKHIAKQYPDDLAVTQLLASSYVAAGRYDAADKTLAKAQHSNPDNQAIVRARAQLAARRGKYAQAIDLLKPLQDKNPDDTNLTLALAGLYARAGDKKQSIDLLAAADKRRPDASRIGRTLVRDYLASSQNDKAMQLIERHLKHRKNDPDWLQLKGVAQLVGGDADAGIKTMAKAAGQAPDRPELSLDVAKAQLSQGRTDDAIKRLQQLRKQSPKFLPAAGFLALAQASEGNTDAALDQVEALRDGGHAYAANKLEGDVLNGAKQYKKADTAYGKAFDQKPTARLAVAMFNARRAGHLDDPAAPLRQWLKQKPDDGAIALRLASWYQSQDENDEAAKVYESILSKHDKAVIALNNLALIRADSNPQQALSYARRAHDRAPNSPAVSDTLGWLLVNNKQLDQGIKLLEQAEAKAGTNSPEIRFHLGAALAMRNNSGDSVRARKLLKQALAAGLSESEAGRARDLVGRLGKTDAGTADNGD